METYVLKDPNLDSVAQTLTSSGFKHRVRSLQSARDILGGTELTSFRLKARREGVGTITPGMEVLADTLVPLLSLPRPSLPSAGGCQI